MAPPIPKKLTSNRALWILVAVLLEIAITVVWLIHANRPTDSASLAPSAAPNAEVQSSTELVDGSTTGVRSAEGPKLAFATDGGIAIPAGVRLAGPGRLTGRVLDRASGEPVTAARVDLLPLPPGGAQTFGRMLRLAGVGNEYAKRVEPIAVTGTNANGEFVFDGVRVGNCFVEARAAHAVPDQVVHARVLASGDGGPIDVFVRAGGRVLGHVLAPNGEPAVGASVALTAGANNLLAAARRGDLCYLECKSDAHGAFVFAGVPPGDGWELSASSRGLTLSHQGDVVVRAGEDTEVVLNAREGGVIRGRILSGRGARAKEDDTSRTPLAGADVGAVPRGLRDLVFVEEVLDATHAVTDADGNYVLEHVPPGEVDVLAIAPGHLPAKGPSTWIADRGRADVADFELARGELVSGRVVDSSGAPIAGAQVRWNMIDMSKFQFDFSFAPLLAQAVKGFEYPKTDADGRFTAGPFAGDPPFSIEFWKTGFENQKVKWDPKSPGELTIVMKSGGAVEGIVMDSTSHEPVTSFSISGTDRIDADAEAPGRMNPFAGGLSVESKDGTFHVAPVKSGKISLDFAAPGYLATSVEDIEVQEGQTTRGVIVALDRGATIVGRVLGANDAPLAGAQVFAKSAEPTSNANGKKRRGVDTNQIVEQAPPGVTDYLVALGFLGDRAVSTKADGTFKLTGVPPGKTIVVATHRDYVPKRSSPIDVALDAPSSIEIKLSQGGGVFGRALDHFQRPLQSAIVIAMSPGNIEKNGGAIYQGHCDANGDYKIEHMSSGGYFLMLTRGDESLHPLSFMSTAKFDFVSVPADELVRYDMHDDSSGAARVFGRVSADGVPAERGNVVAINYESESLLGVDLKIATIREGGNYEFPGLAPGTYRFKLSQVALKGRTMDAELEVDVPDQPEMRIDLPLPSGGIEGRVVDLATEAPIANVELSLSDPSKPQPSGLFGQMMARDDVIRERTDAKGEYKFERLQAANYRLVARPPHDGAAHYAPSKEIEVRVGENSLRRGVDFALEPSLSIHGFVKGADGAPIASATIIARPKGVTNARPESATSAATGAFAIDFLAAGEFELDASADGFAPTHVGGVDLVRGEEKSVELVLQRGVLVRVRILGADGTPLSGVAATLTAKGAKSATVGDANHMFDNLFNGKGVSDADGKLELGHFAPGNYVLDARRALSHTAEDVKLESGSGDVELQVVLR